MSEARPPSLPPVKPPRIIVEHFDIATYKIDHAHGYVEADCQHCGATIKGQKNVTSNFIQHMRRRHPEAYDSFAKSSGPRAKRPRLSPSSSASTPSTPAKVQPSSSAPLQPAPVASSASATLLQVPSAIVPQPQAPVESTGLRSALRPSRPAPFQESPGNASETQRAEMTMETALVSATYRGAVRTACDQAARLSAQTGCQFYVKREDTQVAGTPIFRASYNFLAATPTSRAGLVAAGAGALSVAAAAQKFTKPCLCIVSNGTPSSVLRQLTSYEAKYEIAGDTDQEACALAAKKAVDLSRTYVDLTGPNLAPGCAEAVAGYATIALELLQQRPHTNRVFMSGGNALLFSGVSAVLQRLGRGVKLIGVVHDTILDEASERGDDEADAMGVRDIAEDWASFSDDVIRVGTSEMCAAVKLLFEDCSSTVLEPTGALAVAGALRYARVHKLSHERLAALVDSPLRDFDSLARISRRALQADGTRCTLCIQKRATEGTTNGRDGSLMQLMHELSGMTHGTARITNLMFDGRWPLLIGFACSAATTVSTHVGNLASLGYDAVDVTGSDLLISEAWTWTREDETADNTVRWGVFRVQVLEKDNGVAKFLATERSDCAVGKLALSNVNGGVANLVIAAKGSEWQLETLEREMAVQAIRVRKVSAAAHGLRMIGCGDSPRPEAGADGGNTGLMMTTGGMEGTENGDTRDDHNGTVNTGEGHAVSEGNRTGDDNTDGEGNPASDDHAAGDGEGLAATADVGISFTEGEGEADVSLPGHGSREGEALDEDADDGAAGDEGGGEEQVEAEDVAVPTHAHEEDSGTRHGHSHQAEDVHMHHENLDNANAANENDGDNEDDNDGDAEDVPPHDHHSNDEVAAPGMNEAAAVAAAAAAVAAGHMGVEGVDAVPPR